EDLVLRGHAIECRINAEDPANGFQPSPGIIASWIPPGGRSVRLDSHAHAGYRIPSFYDSMIGKLIVHGMTRDDALATLARALGRARSPDAPPAGRTHAAFRRAAVHAEHARRHRRHRHRAGSDGGAAVPGRRSGAGRARGPASRARVLGLAPLPAAGRRG